MASAILYIDDEPVSPELAGELERRGHDLVESTDPEEVLRRVGSGEPTLVFLEPLLEGCDGLELLESIAALQPDLPVVVVTRGGDPDLHPRALEIGCRDFLTKPVLASQLLACAFDLAGQPVEKPVDTREGDDPKAAAGRELSGGAEGLGFAELFQELHEAGFSGVLVASHRKSRIGLELRNGTPVAASSNEGRERLEDFLLRRGRIRTEEHDSVVDQVAQGVGRVEEILVEMGFVSEDEIRATRAEQGREVLLEPFGWRDATHRVLPGKRLKADAALPVDCSAPAALMEGVLGLAPKAQVHAWLDRSRDLYVSEGARWEREGLALSRENRSLVATFQGDRTLAETVAEGDVDARRLFALALAGALDLHVDPVLVLSEALEPLEPEVEETEAADAAAAGPEPDAAPDAEPEPQAEPESDSGAEPELETPARRKPRRRERKGILRERVRRANQREIERRVAELTALAEHLAERDDFAILEVDEQSSDDEVQRAYQAKLALEPLRPPPELAADPTLAGLIKQIRGSFAEAYKHLRTADGRRVHATLGETPVAKPADAERALDAEGWFRKGEALLSDRDYDKALEALGMANYLDPEQGVYLSHLGYALFLSNPNDELVRREAMEQMAKGIKLSPDSPLSYVFLGRALKAGDDLRNAKRMFYRALKIDADFHAALQEIRLLDTRREKTKKTGLLGRLRRS